MDGGYGATPSTNRGCHHLSLLANVQALSSDSPEQERHPVLSKVESPSRRLTTGTNGRGANSTGKFSEEEMHKSI